jgi:DNA-directed RNA polymerase specialized sigma24 family protein
MLPDFDRADSEGLWQQDYERGRSRSTVRRLRKGTMASYRGPMDVMKFPRRLIRHLETPELPLQTLEAIHRLRRYLDELEAACVVKARELGASPSDIGDALGITRQAVYNRLHTTRPRTRAASATIRPTCSPTSSGSTESARTGATQASA